ncbi:MAG: hypothetical protein WD929_04730 [Steroidobacteraceae bacterium]
MKSSVPILEESRTLRKRRIKATPAETFDFESAALNPTRFYARPQDVLQDASLDAAQKRRVLESWVLDAQLLGAAEGENMPGRASERPFLREAKLALQELDR